MSQAAWIYLGVSIWTFLTIVFLVLQYWLWGKSQASGLLFLMLAESIMVGDMPAEIRPDFINKRALANIEAVNWLVRPVARWYIDRHSMRVVEPALALAIEDLEEQGFIPE